MSKCPNCQYEIPPSWKGRCYPCEDRKEERKGSAHLELTHGEIRFILWALPQSDLWTDEGMRAWAHMGNQDRLDRKLRKCLPEAAPKPVTGVDWGSSGHTTYTPPTKAICGNCDSILTQEEADSGTHCRRCEDGWAAADEDMADL